MAKRRANTYAAILAAARRHERAVLAYIRRYGDAPSFPTAAWKATRRLEAYGKLKLVWNRRKGLRYGHVYQIVPGRWTTDLAVGRRTP